MGCRSSFFALGRNHFYTDTHRVLLGNIEIVLLWTFQSLDSAMAIFTGHSRSPAITLLGCSLLSSCRVYDFALVEESQMALSSGASSSSTKEAKQNHDRWCHDQCALLSVWFRFGLRLFLPNGWGGIGRSSLPYVEIWLVLVCW